MFGVNLIKIGSVVQMLERAADIPTDIQTIHHFELRKPQNGFHRQHKTYFLLRSLVFLFVILPIYGKVKDSHKRTFKNTLVSFNLSVRVSTVEIDI